MAEETKPDLLNPKILMEIISRRRWVIIIALLLSGMVCFYLSLTLTKLYSASTVILVQPQRVPEEYVTSLVTQGVASRINTIAHEITSRANLEKIIQQFELFPSPGVREITMDEKIDQLRARIDVRIKRSKKGARGGGSASAFTITYDDNMPERASNIANALAALFIDENLKIREAQAVGTSGFLEDELENMERRLMVTEKELSDYRSMHRGELPSQLESSLRQLDRLQKEFTDKDEALREAKARLIALLNQSDPPAVKNQPLNAKSSDRSTKGQLQAKLTQLQARYTDKHPDIIRLKQLLAEYSTNTGDAEGEAQIVIDTREEISEYEKDLADIREKIAFYGARVEKIPEREQDLISLRRDYQKMRDSYHSLLDRKLEAEIALNMERKQKGEQFRLIDPAHPPTLPIFPDTMKLFAIALACGLGLGGGISFLLEYLTPFFRRPEEIETVLGLPVVATIPVLPSRKGELVQHINTIMTVAASGAVCVVYGLFGALIFLGESELKSVVNNYFNTLS